MTDSPTGPDYASPRTVEGLEECYFYHSIDLPEIGEIQGDWDLRNCIDEYLGNFDFQGKRVLDVGTASGFLTFEMEKRGAEVLSLDMTSGRDWDSVPYPEQAGRLEKILESQEQAAERLKNSYWLAHRLLKSKARVRYGNIYQPLPESIGEFDVAVFGTIFTHLRDPFGAFCAILPRVKESVILTNSFISGEGPIARFAPTVENQQRYSFWMPSEICVFQMFKVLGFEPDRAVTCLPRCELANHPAKEYTALVASRR